nr:MAG TPA: hypothetical protein [Caudoviricetes sp.]
MIVIYHQDKSHIMSYDIIIVMICNHMNLILGGILKKLRI